MMLFNKSPAAFKVTINRDKRDQAHKQVEILNSLKTLQIHAATTILFQKSQWQKRYGTAGFVAFFVDTSYEACLFLVHRLLLKN